MNRYKEKWGFQDMIDSVGYDRACKLVDYYFATENKHTIQGLLYSFDVLDESLTQRDADRAYRARLLEETKKRLEQSESRTTDN